MVEHGSGSTVVVSRVSLPHVYSNSLVFNIFSGGHDPLNLQDLRPCIVVERIRFFHGGRSRSV